MDEMVYSLGDDHSVYLDPEQVEAEEEVVDFADLKAELEAVEEEQAEESEADLESEVEAIAEIVSDEAAEE